MHEESTGFIILYQLHQFTGLPSKPKLHTRAGALDLSEATHPGRGVGLVSQLSGFMSSDVDEEAGKVLFVRSSILPIKSSFSSRINHDVSYF